MVDSTARHARRIAVENLDVFDATQPIAAVQLVIVDHRMLGRRTGRGWRLAAAERIRAEPGYSAFAALLDARRSLAESPSASAISRICPACRASCPAIDAIH